MLDTVVTRRCKCFEKGVCNIFCFLRSKKYGQPPRYLGDGIVDYSKCEVIKEFNKRNTKSYAF